MDIDKILNSIEAMRDFQSENTSTEDQIRTFLVSRFGPAWYDAKLLAHISPEGKPVYTAMLPIAAPMRKATMAMAVVCEREDGTLALAAPIPLVANEQDEDEREELAVSNVESDDYLDEQNCLARIIPALIEARAIVAASEDVKAKRKKRIRSEIEHACKHLQMHLDELRRSA